MCGDYENRPDCCHGYPWNDANDIFPDCQFFDKDSKKLRTIEEQRLLKPQQEIESFCLECGKCCMFWDKGKPVAQCSMLRVFEVESYTFRDGRLSLPLLPKEMADHRPKEKDDQVAHERPPMIGVANHGGNGGLLPPAMDGEKVVSHNE